MLIALAAYAALTPIIARRGGVPALADASMTNPINLGGLSAGYSMTYSPTLTGSATGNHSNQDAWVETQVKADTASASGTAQFILINNTPNTITPSTNPSLTLTADGYSASYINATSQASITMAKQSAQGLVGPSNSYNAQAYPSIACGPMVKNQTYTTNGNYSLAISE